MTVTLAELLAKIRAAQGLMSRKNAHRLLLGQCEAVILGLVDELNKANCPVTDTPPEPPA